MAGALHWAGVNAGELLPLIARLDCCTSEPGDMLMSSPADPMLLRAKLIRL